MQKNTCWLLLTKKKRERKSKNYGKREIKKKKKYKYIKLDKLNEFLSLLENCSIFYKTLNQLTLAQGIIDFFVDLSMIYLQIPIHK